MISQIELFSGMEAYFQSRILVHVDEPECMLIVNIANLFSKCLKACNIVVNIDCSPASYGAFQKQSQKQLKSLLVLESTVSTIFSTRTINRSGPLWNLHCCDPSTLLTHSLACRKWQSIWECKEVRAHQSSQNSRAIGSSKASHSRSHCKDCKHLLLKFIIHCLIWKCIHLDGPKTSCLPEF